MANPVAEEAPKFVAQSLLRRENVVFLFGAGASLSSGVPGAGTLKTRLWEDKLRPYDWNKGSPSLRNCLLRVGVDEAKLVSPGHFDPIRDADLEQLLTAACQLEMGETEEERAERIAEWLEEQIPDVHSRSAGMHHFASLGYEFTCHLASNGLVRNIVNMNYDEILDRELERELLKKSLFRAVTLEDYQRLANTDDWSNLGECFLIKPHGTRSMRRSCRFRIDQVGVFEPDKAKTMKKALKDAILVMVGYEAADVDFKKMLGWGRGLKTIRKIVVVKQDPQRVVDNLHCDGSRFVPYEGRDGRFFEALASALYASGYDRYFTKATRHFIRAEVSSCINPTSQEKAAAQTAVLKDDPLFFEKLDLLVEIMIYCFKIRGLFITRALHSCNRISAALDEYLAAKTDGSDRSPIHEVLAELLPHLLKKKDKDTELFRNWYYLPEEMSSQEGSLFKDAATRYAEFLANTKLGPFLDDARTGEALIRQLAKRFVQLTEEFDYDLERGTAFYFLPFRNPVSITTREQFRKLSDGILKKAKKYGNLDVVSPSVAEWLAKWGTAELRDSGVKVRVMVNQDIIDIRDSIHFRHIREKLSAVMQDAVVKARPRLAYGMSLTQESDGEKTSGEAVIFIREGKASSFGPVFISEDREPNSSSDIAKLKRFFDSMFDATPPLDKTLRSKSQ